MRRVETMRYLKIEEVCGTLEIDRDFLSTLVDQGLVEIKRSTEDEPVVSVADADRLRVAVMLLREMEVNLPGVEVILHMRDELVAMQRQVDEIMQALVEELRKRLA